MVGKDWQQGCGSALLRLADCQGNGLLGRHEGGSLLVKIGSRVVDSHHLNADSDPAPFHSDANVRPHFPGIKKGFSQTGPKLTKYATLGNRW